MSFELRQYQKEAESAILKEWKKGNKKTLLNLATGLGKTVVFSRIAQRVAESGHRVLIIAHRAELLEQAADKIKQMTGMECSFEKAQYTSVGSDKMITIASIQTMSQPNRLKKFARDYFNVIIIDEAHHCMADTYQRVLKHFKDAYVLGVTATPDRGDNRSLSEFFDSEAYSYGMFKGIQDKYLCPIKALLLPLKIDFTKVKMSAGDFSLRDEDAAIEPYLKEIARIIAEEYADRKTVIFLPLVNTSKKMCTFLNELGVPAVEINGSSPDRSEKFADYYNGKYKVLCNAMLATEGWDCPSVDCIIVLRPTKIRSFYQQMVGRGTRLYPGKKELLLLDFLWLTDRHDLCVPTSLFSTDELHDSFMKKRFNEQKEPVDLISLTELASKDATEARERALAEQLKAMRDRNKKLIDPVQYFVSIGLEHLANYRPIFKWEKRPATDAQLNALEKIGIDPACVKNRGEASTLLDEAIKRSEIGLATPKQIRCLEKYSFKHVGQWKFEDASYMIDQIARSRWNIPFGIIPWKYIPDNGLFKPL